LLSGRFRWLRKNQFKMHRSKEKKERERENAKRHRANPKNRKKIEDRAYTWTIRQRFILRLIVDKHKSENPCVDCGEGDPVVLDFDHVRGKKRLDISRMLNRGFSVSALKLEIEKCEMRCANCHRRKSHEAKSWFGNGRKIREGRRKAQ